MKKNECVSSKKKRLMPPGKILKIMKLLTLFMLALIMHVSAKTYSQNTKLSMNMQNVSIKQVLSKIEDQTEYRFLYSDSKINVEKLINVDFKDLPIEEVLRNIFDNDKVYFKLMGRQVVLSDESENSVAQAPQKITVSGKVTDSSGDPIPGASIRAKGTNIGRISDAEGWYSLPGVSSDGILVFSFVGMKTQEIHVKGRERIDVQLAVAMSDIEEVVVTGYQTRTKAQNIGAVSTIKASELETAGNVTIDKAISGKLAGVYVRSTSGQPGEVGEIRIRGINTMTGDKEPLYVLDGMPLQSGEITGDVSRILTTGIGNIPPEDIETITILKDAAAASIYGSRAANGVVVITTKVGKVGKDYINYTGKIGVTMAPTNKFSFMNSQEKIDFERGIYNDFHPIYGGRVVQLLNMADNGVITSADAEAQIANLSKINTNWFDEIYSPATSHSHNLSMSGGNSKTQYFASLNYQNSDGTLLNNNYQTGGLTMKLSHYFKDNFLIRFNLYSTLKNNKRPLSQIDPFKYAVFANPYEKPYEADGSYSSDESYRDRTNNLGTSSDLNYNTFNIIRELNENTLTSMYGNTRGQLSFEYSFLKGFRFVSSAVLDYTTVHEMDESQAGTYRSYFNNWIKGGFGNPVLPAYNQGFLKENMVRTTNFTIRNSLEYAKTFDKKHLVQLFIANDISGTRNYGFNHFNPIYYEEYRMVGYPSWGDINSTTSGDMISSKYNLLKLNAFGGTSFRENRAVSFIGSAVYSFSDKYVFNGNWRLDGVDIIGSTNRFTPLWSTAVKWNAHNENFLKPYEDILSRLVVSFSYGYRGSINRSVYPFHVYTLGTRNYDGMLAASAINYGNPVLKWERKGEKTLGLEMSFFKGRINLEGQYFSERIEDLLDQTPLPVSVGRVSTTVNVGSLSNKGLELSARVEAVKTKDFLFEIGGNITKVKNVLEKVYNSMTPYIASNTPQFVQGYATNSWFGYKFSHIDEKTGQAMVWARKENTALVDGVIQKTYTDQLINIESVTSASLQANYRTYYLGKRDPNLFGGFNSRIVYKEFELMGQFVFASGNKIIDFQDRLNGPSGQTDDITASRTNRLTENVNRWRQPGDITDIPKFGNSVSNYTRYLVDRDLSDGSYLKCNTLALSWRMPARTLKNAWMHTLRLSLMANNLFTLTNYRGTDPETQTPFGYPNAKSYTLSMTLGF